MKKAFFLGAVSSALLSLSFSAHAQQGINDESFFLHVTEVDDEYFCESGFRKSLHDQGLPQVDIVGVVSRTSKLRNFYAPAHRQNLIYDLSGDYYAIENNLDIFSPFVYCADSIPDGMERYYPNFTGGTMGVLEFAPLEVDYADANTPQFQLGNIDSERNVVVFHDQISPTRVGETGRFSAEIAFNFNGYLTRSVGRATYYEEEELFVFKMEYLGPDKSWQELKSVSMGRTGSNITIIDSDNYYGRGSKWMKLSVDAEVPYPTTVRARIAYKDFTKYPVIDTQGFVNKFNLDDMGIYYPLLSKFVYSIANPLQIKSMKFTAERCIPDLAAAPGTCSTF